MSARSESGRRPWDAYETILLAAFKKAFGDPDLSVSDDFFELGGTSMTALTLLAEAAQIQPAITVAELFEAPRVDELADLVRTQGRRGATGNVVRLNPRAEGTVLIFSHGVTGEVLHAGGLSAVSSDRPLFLLRAPGIDGEAEPRRTIEELGEVYVPQLVDALDGRRCIITGYSMGGLVAWELAGRLAAAGADVRAVALLATDSPDALRRYEADLGTLRWDRLLNIAGLSGLTIARGPEPDPTPDRVAEVLAMLQSGGRVPSTTEVHVLARRLDVYARNRLAAAAYELPQLDVPLTVVAASDDRDYDWRQHVDAPVERVEVSATHDDMLVEPSEAVALVDRLAARFDES